MLRVTISGTAGVGKTTLAYAVAAMLRGYGIESIVTDTDAWPAGVRLEERMAAVRRTLADQRVLIDTVQVRPGGDDTP